MNKPRLTWFFDDENSYRANDLPFPARDEAACSFGIAPGTRRPESGFSADGAWLLWGTG